ncbi:unnamed protein product [Oikopleura dioica]|uniref:Uncharacterized protein n=1 Tax=Oikopleura dioica TaxID=34765 RepID=E4YQA8_OIKDI|nr:unnamed protein product [Oikopleura dioica]
MCLSLSAETSPRIKSFVYSLHVSVIFILIAAFELTESENNASLRKGVFLVSLGLTLLSLLYVRARFSPGLWDEETNSEGREDTGPKPPTYEVILESNAEMFKRLAIDDPEAPPPTIGTGLRIGIPVNDDYKPPNYVQSEGEPPSFIESTGIIEVETDGVSILESRGNLDFVERLQKTPVPDRRTRTRTITDRSDGFLHSTNSLAVPGERIGDSRFSVAMSTNSNLHHLN